MRMPRLVLMLVGVGGISLVDVLDGNVSGDIDITVTNPVPINGKNNMWGYNSYSHLFTRSTITSLTVNGLLSVPGKCAYGVTTLHTVSFAGAITGGGSAFENCTNLVSAFFPDMTDTYYNYSDLSSSMFKGCSKLANVNVRKINRVSSSMFQNCPVLNNLDFERVNNVSANGFSGDSALDTIIIRSTAVATLQNVNSFANTPFTSGGTGGTLYVPQALISSYQSATNWSTILGYANNSIQAIEGSQYENYYADGTPIS